MKMHFVVIGLVVLCIGLAAADCSDDDVRRLVIRSGSYIDNPELAREDFRLARDLCEADTNRFARILYELARTGDMRVKDRMISRLGRYGTAAELPFLYSMATNAWHGATAVKAILRLEGVTSNSVAVAGTYLSMTNVDFEYRAEACQELLRAAARPLVSQAMCHHARDCALRYARFANRYVSGVDAAFVETDSTYLYSKRRLGVMRSVFNLGVSQYQIAYVTNAINELVAYPEAELPE